MLRIFLSALFCLVFSSLAQAQGVLERAGQGLDRAGKNIRRGVEQGVARGQATVQGNQILGRVSERIRWDKQLASSSLRLTVSADASVTLRGSVPTESAKARAVDLAESTVGVTSVVDELVIAKEVRVVRPKTGSKPVIVEEPKDEVIIEP